MGCDESLANRLDEYAKEQGLTGCELYASLITQSDHMQLYCNDPECRTGVFRIGFLVCASEGVFADEDFYYEHFKKLIDRHISKRWDKKEISES